MTHKIHGERLGVRKNFDRKKKTVHRELLEDLDVGVRKLSGGGWNGILTVGLGTGVGLL
jgi:hypothetical protein